MINDSQVHDAGDGLLTEGPAVGCSNAYVRGDSVARLGGDRFVMLLTGVQGERLTLIDLVAGRVIAAMEIPFKLPEPRASSQHRCKHVSTRWRQPLGAASAY